ncbi:hypothetical protein BC835DRAFT_32351 [Cytidiella melzeri]|nr:hypothetical protein BC835DRAFT_32351 [Cytidiella melzeri]
MHGMRVFERLVSECMGQQPLILENSFTTKLPADVDEEKFSPSSTTIPTFSTESGEAAPTYLGLKCRLVQLVKGIRRQAAKDLADDDVSIDQAASGEAEISTWLSDLPPAFRLNMEADMAHSLSGSPSTSPFVVAQRCDLVIAANHVVLKLYLPFMKESCVSSGSKPSHQALMGTINAAHAVIYASRVLHSLWRDTRPTAFDYYDYGRSLFDAAIICAYAVIQQPKNILAAEAIKSLSSALEVMHALDNIRTGLDASGSPSEATHVVELMKEKAERARASEVAPTGTKRKRNDSLPLREAKLAGGFQLPYVGASVSFVKPDQSRVTPLASKIADVTASRRGSLGNPPDAKAFKSSSSSGKKDKDKASKYPPIGIRVRSPQSPPPTSQMTYDAGINHAGPAATNPAAVSPMSPPDGSQQSSTLSSHSNTAAYQYPQTHVAPSQQQEPRITNAMRHDFQLEYNHTAGPANDHYHSSFASDSSPGSSSGYEHAPPPPPSASSYDINSSQPPQSFRSVPPSNPQEYYMPPTPFTPNPSAYEQQSSQSMSMPVSYGMPPPIDTSMNGGGVLSIPGTPRDSYHILPAKSSSSSGGPHFDTQLGKSELDRQMHVEYQPTATSHGIAMTATSMTAPYVQGWRPDVRQSHPWEYRMFNPHS